jgi:hypothetical protein
MNRTIILDAPAKITAAIRLLEELPPGPVHVVKIEEFSENKSAAQRRLQWLWNTEIGNYMGMGKEEVHDMLKEKFAVPILVRDDQGYAEMVEAVKQVRRAGMNKEADHLKKEIIRLTSTERFSVKQTTEYLSQVERYAAEIGATLTFPEDIYLVSMGIKK